MRDRHTVSAGLSRGLARSGKGASGVHVSDIHRYGHECISADICCPRQIWTRISYHGKIFIPRNRLRPYLRRGCEQRRQRNLRHPRPGNADPAAASWPFDPCMWLAHRIDCIRAKTKKDVVWNCMWCFVEIPSFDDEALRVLMSTQDDRAARTGLYLS